MSQQFHNQKAMDANVFAVLQSTPFRKLVSSRRRVSLFLSLIIIFVYFGFILTIAFNKELMTTKIGNHITIALPIGTGIIVFAWILTGIYVRWANSNYDRQVEAIKKQLFV
jgi:uncharacterized membrane protein (DUF485 family)